MTPINPESLGAPKGFSNGILAAAGGRTLFIAGQIAWDREHRIVCDDFVGQFARSLANVVEVVRAAGGLPEHLARLTLYVTDKREYLENLKTVGESYRGIMGRHFPAMSLLEVRSLLEPRAKIEIEGTAVIP